jgi:SAM-dependent methyltransferase
MQEHTKFDPHRISWTPEKVSRVWDFISSHSTGLEKSFSVLKGDALLRFLQHHRVALAGHVLDFGCGPGYLLEKLVTKGITCTGLELSQESLDEARRRIGDHDNLKELVLVDGLPAPLPDEAFDVVFLIEILEHVLDRDLDLVSREVLRLLKVGGMLVVTVPNQEDLQTGMVMCPECGCIFHRVQHVRSWNVGEMSAWMNRAGFEEVICKPTYLTDETLLSKARACAYRVLRMSLPNLVYVGRKPT